MPNWVTFTSLFFAASLISFNSSKAFALPLLGDLGHLLCQFVQLLLSCIELTLGGIVAFACFGFLGSLLIRSCAS